MRRDGDWLVWACLAGVLFMAGAMYIGLSVRDSAPGRVIIVLPTILLGIVFAERAAVLRRRVFRERAGCCRWCGYDLRGSTNGVCSECGEPIEKR